MLSFPPQLDMRTYFPAPTREDSQEAPHNLKGFLSFQRQHERLHEVPVATRGNPNFLLQLEKHLEVPPSIKLRPDSPDLTTEQSSAPPRNSNGDLTSLMQQERLPEFLVVTGEESHAPHLNSRKNHKIPPKMLHEALVSCSA